jgi:undecaprenyl-diphosphatase
MNILQAVILGIIQGVAEFLPISSSGHLAVLERVFGITEPAMTFDIVVHLGSLMAVLVVFRKDILEILKHPFSKMTWLLIVGTIPTVIAAFFFKDALENVFRTGLPLAFAFLVTGVLLVFADRFKEGTKSVGDISYLDALVVGCMQAVGIPPGISRSGATITGALARGLTREAAARFSFLLSIIAIAGAGVLEAADIIREPSAVNVGALPMVFGFLSSALVGYLAIQWLLKLIKSCKLKYFAYYVAVLAVLIFVDTVGTHIFF